MEELAADEGDFEEVKESVSRLAREADQALENSLNKSDLTMEDNNKASK